jgi:ABC-type transport system substrate-binding protein
MPLRAKVGTLDPVRCGSQYDAVVVSAVYESLFQYDYLERSYELEPNLLEGLPEVSEDLTTYTFTLKKGVLFPDDPAFPNARGREMTSDDVIYSIKRMANREFLPNGWWIYNERIKGFDAYKKEQAERKEGTPFDYEARVE